MRKWYVALFGGNPPGFGYMLDLSGCEVTSVGVRISQFLVNAVLFVVFFFRRPTDTCHLGFYLNV